MESERGALLYAYAVRSHHFLEHLSGQLLDAMRSHAPDVDVLWRTLDRELRIHMETEERFVLSAFASIGGAAALDDALAILRDHAYFREQMLEIGTAIDLHALYDRSRELIERMADHGALEEQLLYRWADQHLGAHAIQSAIEFAGGAP